MFTRIAKQKVIRQVLGVLNNQFKSWEYDRYSKKLVVGSTVILFLEAILEKRKSVKNIAEHLKSNRWMQRWVGLETIHESSLNRKLNKLPTAVLRDTYVELLAQLKRDFPQKELHPTLGPMAAVDSTSITLGKIRGEWAYQQKGKTAVKQHTRLELGGENRMLPTAVVCSTAVVADLDSEVLAHLVAEETVTYLMDRGYINYGQFLDWDRCGIPFVARIKSNSKVRVLRSRPVSADFIEKDEDVELTDPTTGKTGIFRLVTYRFIDEKGNLHRIRALTNRHDVSDAAIAQAYRYRWQVEVFFKRMKQKLNLSKCYCAKPVAMWNQIYLNLIAYVLCEYCRLKVAPEQEFEEVMDKLKLYLMRPWEYFIQNLHPTRQRTSKGRRKKGGRPRIHPKIYKANRLLYY